MSLRRVQLPGLCLAVMACGPLPQLQHARPAPGEPASNECALDIVNGQDVPMAVTIHARNTYDLGVLRPFQTTRYAEECTARTWTVTAIPRLATGKDAEDEGKPPPTGFRYAPSPVTQQVDVRPGEVSRVEL